MNHLLWLYLCRLCLWLILLQSWFKSTQLQTHTYCAVISKSRENPKPDHHRLSTEHKHILKGLTDSGSPHYWSYTAQVFPSPANCSHCEWLHASTQRARAAFHLPLGTPGSTLLQTSRRKGQPKTPTPSLLMELQALLFPQQLWCKHKITSFAQKLVGRRTRKEQKYDQITYSFEATLLLAHLPLL